MLLIVEKGIRDGICHTIYHYAKDNNFSFRLSYQNSHYSFTQI